MKRNEYRTGAVPESLVQVILSKPGGTKERNIFALVALARIRIRLEKLVPAFSAVKMRLRIGDHDPCTPTRRTVVS